VAFYPGTEGHTVARVRAPNPKAFVIPNGLIVRDLLLGFAASSLQSLPELILSRCGNHLEILWEAQIDRIKRRQYVCKVSRTVGFAFVRFRLD
jgi:hypothetical protein